MNTYYNQVDSGTLFSDTKFPRCPQSLLLQFLMSWDMLFYFWWQFEGLFIFYSSLSWDNLNSWRVRVYFWGSYPFLNSPVDWSWNQCWSFNFWQKPDAQNFYFELLLLKQNPQIRVLDVWFHFEQCRWWRIIFANPYNNRITPPKYRDIFIGL